MDEDHMEGDRLDGDACNEEPDYDASTAEPIYRLAYEISLRELDGQIATLDQVRVRATALLGLVFTSGAFFGGLFAKVPPESQDGIFWILIGTGSFGVAAAALFAFMSIWPAKWTFQSSAQKIVEEYWVHPLSRALRELAFYNEANAAENNMKLQRRHRWIVVSICGAALELTSWLFLAVRVG